MLRLHVQTAGLLLVSAASVGARAQTTERPKWDNMLNGPWYLNNYFAGGERKSETTVYYFTDGVVCIASRDRERIQIFGYTATIDKSQTPHQITFKSLDDANELLFGIYQSQKDRLMLAYGTRERPKSFKKIEDEHLTPSSDVPHILELKRGFAPGLGYGENDANSDRDPF
jgi:uncharacterized protein (TIGR03067 family)